MAKNPPLCTSIVRGRLLHDVRATAGRAKVRPGQRFNAGWSSPVARQAHNLKVIGSNPIPATTLKARSANALAGFSTRKVA